MTDKITNIEELYELVNPELLTSENSCLDMIDKACKNEKLINNYIKNVIKRLAKIENKKVIIQESKYDVSCVDYFVDTDIENILSCDDSLYSEVVDYLDGYDFSNYEELKE